MNKRLKITLIVLGVVLGFVIIKYLMKTFSSKKQNDTLEPAEVSTLFPLQIGSKNTQVKTLQKYLNSNGTGTKLIIDGIFGNKTADKLFNTLGLSIIPKDLFPYVDSNMSASFIKNIIQNSK